MEETEYYHNEYIRLKQEIMDKFGYTESDMEFEEIEDKVNRLTDNKFSKLHEFDYSELID